MEMSIPIKFQIKLGIQAEGKYWDVMMMLCDGSLYGIERRGESNYRRYDDPTIVHPINRTFAGQLLKEKKKLEVASLNKLQEQSNNLHKDLRMFQRRVGELVGQTTKSAFNERLERRETIKAIKNHIADKAPGIKTQRENLAHVERCIQKFKGITKTVPKNRQKPSRTQRAKQKPSRAKTANQNP